MNPRYILMIAMLLVPIASNAQGVRMSADFLPLEVGNRWVYELKNEDGQKIGDLDFAVQEHAIIEGRSFYVMSRFPFVVADGNLTQLIRYDRSERQYVMKKDTEEMPLFLSDGASAEVLQADEAGVPSKFILKMDLMELTFQRGLGIVEARIHGANGLQIAKMTSAKVGERKTESTPEAAVPGRLPEPPAPARKAVDLSETVAKITDENPVLDVQVTEVPEGHKFILTIINTEDKLLPMKFASGQSYDFAVMDMVTGQEIWRWSRRQFFVQKVVRQESIRAKRNWKFEVVWNNRDNDLNRVEPGRYQVVGIVTVDPPIESDPVIFEIK